jgi:uncharacterized membrane-anchored protein
MKARWTRVVIVAATLVVLVAVNGSIVAKERIKSSGERIYLALAPVDPRSLMQGDYMALRFVVADQIPTVESGTWPLRVDERGIAAFNPDRNASGLRIRYRVRNERVWLGTNAYFFEEGTAERFANAAFGEFRVDRESGEAILVGLRDAQLNRL